MTTSVRTKAGKKQQPHQKKQPAKDAIPAYDRVFEQSLMALENACALVLEQRESAFSDDPDEEFWRNTFINIATPVSLALAEYKGPRHFHYHYRHREDDESVLTPVLDNPVETLALAATEALAQCRGALAGIQNEELLNLRRALEISLVAFLSQYEQYRKRL